LPQASKQVAVKTQSDPLGDHRIVILMFCVGLALTITAAAKGFRGRNFFGQTLSIGELELLNLTRLYFYRPVEQIRIIMPT
jgi:hypothetical protein